MHGTLAVKPEQKTARDIEWLLLWTFGDELPKRKMSSAEGIWDRLQQHGSLGGISPDPGHGAAQRYPHFGLPHPDAERIEKAVAALEPVATDWDQFGDLLLWDLASLVSVNDLQHVSRETIWTSAKVGPAADGRGVTVSPHKPRDVLLIHTVDVGTIVYSHANKGDRPGGWRTGDMRPVPTPAERGPLAKVIGLCKGKNAYSSGSYCPLRWDPSPIKIVMARAVYLAWYQALERLANELRLSEHIALPPAVSPTPWAWLMPPQPRIFYQPPIRSWPLPLKPARKRAGPKLLRKKAIAKGGKSIYRSHNSPKSGTKSAV